MKKLIEDALLFIVGKAVNLTLGVTCIMLSPFLSPVPVAVITFVLGVVVLYLTFRDAYYE